MCSVRLMSYGGNVSIAAPANFACILSFKRFYVELMVFIESMALATIYLIFVHTI